VTPDQPASDVVDGLQTMLVDRYREALRQAVALLPCDSGNRGACPAVWRLVTSWCAACAFVSRPDIVRLLAGEPTTPVSTCSHCFCLLEADESATCCRCRESLAQWLEPVDEPTAQPCGKCEGTGEVTVQTYLSGVRASIPCPACRPAQMCGECGGSGAVEAEDKQQYGEAEPCPACQPAQPEAGATIDADALRNICTERHAHCCPHLKTDTCGTSGCGHTKAGAE